MSADWGGQSAQCCEARGCPSCTRYSSVQIHYSKLVTGALPAPTILRRATCLLPGRDQAPSRNSARAPMGLDGVHDREVQPHRRSARWHVRAPGAQHENSQGGSPSCYQQGASGLARIAPEKAMESAPERAGRGSGGQVWRHLLSLAVLTCFLLELFAASAHTPLTK